MAGQQPRNSFPLHLGDRLSNFAVTMTCWVYFTIGFVLFFSVRFLIAYMFSPQRENSFQRLTSLFCKGFFRIVRVIAPCHRWIIDQRITGITSSVIICNHLSYLDPLLLISLLARQKTIVKTKFFQVPIFGWFLRNTGYFPADGKGNYAWIMINQVEKMNTYLADGGNLFVFPEETRSRDGKIGSMNLGALKIARLCRAPVYVLHLSGTDKLFPPGKFFFNTRIKNTISLRMVDHIEPESDPGPSLTELDERIRNALLLQAESAAGIT